MFSFAVADTENASVCFRDFGERYATNPTLGKRALNRPDAVGERRTKRLLRCDLVGSVNRLPNRHGNLDGCSFVRNYSSFFGHGIVLRFGGSEKRSSGEVE